MNTALILVDLQNDFMPGGALAVPGGDEVISVANGLIPKFDTVVLTQDWHPVNHGSFASQHEGAEPFQEVELEGLPQVAWPDHCVQGTEGAEFHVGLQYDDNRVHVFQKGTDPKADSYSGFFDNAKRGDTGLDAFLRERGIKSLHIMGLATDYCVKFTVLDALDLGYDVKLVVDGCRGLTQESSADAIRAMMDKGSK